MHRILGTPLLPLFLCACGPAGSFLEPTPSQDALRALAPFGGTCTFVPASNLLTLQFPAGGDLAILVRRAPDNVLLVNGDPCPSAGAAPVLASSVNVHHLTVTGGAGDDTLVLDLTGGAFSLGRGGAPGVVVDLGGGSNAFKLRAGALGDRLVAGALGLSLGGANLDISLVQPDLVEPSVELALGDGNDTVSTGGSAVTGTAFTHALTVLGGNGNDTLEEGPSQNGATTFSGGAGVDTCSYAQRAAPLVISLDGIANDGDPSGLGEGDNIQDDVEVVVGGSGADVLRSGPLPVQLQGGKGDDTFDEGTVATPGTVMLGGPGFDQVTYANRVSTSSIHVTLGALVDDGDAAAAERDDVRAGVERVVGGPGNDVLTGGPGQDTLCGGPGNDVLNGGAGDDIFEAALDAGGDTFVGGAGVDVVDYSGRVANLHVDMLGTGAVPDADDGAAGELDDVQADVEDCVGGDGDDTITGNALDNTLMGGAGNDALSGGAGNDTLEGGAASGVQVLACGSGDDIAISTASPHDQVLPDCEL